MEKKLILAAIFLTLFVDFFNLGLIYPVFNALIFEGSALVASNASDFYKNALFGCLITLFPLGQFFGAPMIGQLSDHYGRRKLLILSLIGTVLTLLLCALGILLSSLGMLLLGRLLGGLMAGNMTLAYATLADFSSPTEKARNFALIPLTTGLGFTFGPYLAGLLATPSPSSLTGPAIPFLLATLLSLSNLLVVGWKFPETVLLNQSKTAAHYSLGLNKAWQTFMQPHLKPYLWLLLFMLSANWLFIQFIGAFAIDRLRMNVTDIGYLYANIGLSVAVGHLFFTRQIARYCTSAQALRWSLLFLALFLVFILFSRDFLMLHLLTCAIMLACAVAYTNAMTLVSNQAAPEQQGEVMGLAVSIQSLAECLPALILGVIAALSQALPLLAAAGCALYSFTFLTGLSKVIPQKIHN